MDINRCNSMTWITCLCDLWVGAICSYFNRPVALEWFLEVVTNKYAF